MRSKFVLITLGLFALTLLFTRRQLNICLYAWQYRFPTYYSQSFKSKEAAMVWVRGSINLQSALEDTEYSGVVVLERSTGLYKITQPLKGTENGSYIVFPWTFGVDIVGDYHTHGRGGDPGYEHASHQDKDTFKEFRLNMPNYDSYVICPSGKIIRLEMADNIVYETTF